MNTKVETYHPVFEVIQKYDYLLSPLSAGIIGFVNQGQYGAIAGLGLGSADLIAKHYKLYNKNYLTYSVIGWGVSFHFEAPYYLNQIFGLCIGALLPTGILEDHFDKVIAPATGALYGQIAIGGQYGIATGIVAGIIDEAAKDYNISSGYYLSSSLSDYAILNIYTTNLANFFPSYFSIFNNPTFKITATGIISALSIYDSSNEEEYGDEDEESIKSSVITLSRNLYEAMNKTISQEQLDDILEKRNIALTTLNLLEMTATLGLASRQQGLAQSFHVLDSSGFGNFFNAFISFVKFIPITVAHKAIENLIQSYFSIKLHNIIHDKMYSNLINGEASLYLLKNHSSLSIDSNTILQNIDEDVDNIIQNGNSLLTSQISSIFKGVYASVCIYNNGAVDMILISQNYNDITSYITSYLSNKVEGHSATIKNLESKLTSLNEYTRTHASEMIQNDANNFVLEIYNDTSNALKEKIAQQDFYEAIYLPWVYLRSLIDFFFNYFVIANKIDKGELKNSKRFEVLFIINEVSSMIGWETYNIAGLTKLNQSLTRFNQFSEIMSKFNRPLEHEATYSYFRSLEPKICLNNFKVGIQNKKLLNINHTCILGKKIAITGESGSGKTSFFKILKQIKHDDVWGEGSIGFFSQAESIPKISMVSQKTYIPPYVNLLELITYKKGHKNLDSKKQVIELLKEIGINSSQDKSSAIDIISRIEESENWENKLSGGQIQKIAIVRMILEKPDIILCDEIFKGLDPKSIAVVKAMINKYLPNAQLLIIDHEANAHNEDNFYDYNFHFSNETAIIGAMINVEETSA